MDRKRGEMPRLRDVSADVMAGDVADEGENISSAKIFFDSEVMRAVKDLAVGLHRSGRVDICEMGAGDVDGDTTDFADEVERFLKAEAREHGEFVSHSRNEERDGFCLEELDGDIFVWLGPGYEVPWTVFVSDRSNMPDSISSFGGIYVFRSEDYLPKDEFMGRRYYDILSALTQIHGRESDICMKVAKLIGLTRALIFKVVCPVEGRRKAFSEVVAICMEIGAPAKAVVADFVAEFEWGDGEDFCGPDVEPMGDDPELCIGASGCPFEKLIK